MHYFKNLPNEYIIRSTDDILVSSNDSLSAIVHDNKGISYVARQIFNKCDLHEYISQSDVVTYSKDVIVTRINGITLHMHKRLNKSDLDKLYELLVLCCRVRIKHDIIKSNNIISNNGNWMLIDFVIDHTIIPTNNLIYPHIIAHRWMKQLGKTLHRDKMINYKGNIADDIDSDIDIDIDIVIDDS